MYFPKLANLPHTPHRKMLQNIRRPIPFQPYMRGK